MTITTREAINQFRSSFTKVFHEVFSLVITFIILNYILVCQDVDAYTHRRVQETGCPAAPVAGVLASCELLNVDARS